MGTLCTTYSHAYGGLIGQSWRRVLRADHVSSRVAFYLVRHVAGSGGCNLVSGCGYCYLYVFAMPSTRHGLRQDYVALCSVSGELDGSKSMELPE